jgi:hypothetical protein
VDFIFGGLQEPWYPESVAVSSFGTGTSAKNYATFSFVDQEALQARISIYDLVSGTILSDILTAKNAQLQTVPTVRMDQDFAGVCLWGDKDDVPTVYVIRAGDSAPLFSYVTPGS